jgi:lysine/ornithine N-monooxygenase
MHELVILGGGPRGLAIALRAIQQSNLNITIIDESFLSTWSTDNMISDVQMRSPISFDLTSLCPDLSEYSLPKYLNIPITVNSLKDLEEINIFCHRHEFKSYLKYIIKILKSNNVRFIKDRILRINPNTVGTAKKDIVFDSLVVATGKGTQYIKRPAFLQNTGFVTADVYNNDWFNKEVNVIGNGQQSAEYVDYLYSQHAKITWIVKKEIKVSQYPIPSYTEWGSQSGFSSFYKDQALNKQQYLSNIKQWGATITPYIYNKIKDIPINKIINPKTTANLNSQAPFILATGAAQDLDLLNINFNLKRDITNNCLPAIKTNFQSESHPNIYFTGLLSLKYDGPRQGSIMSSAPTAKIIINSIIKNHGG